MKNIVNNLTILEKVELLKELVDNLDIVITAAYGASGYISGEYIYIATEDDSDYHAKKGKTVFISTDICTG